MSLQPNLGLAARPQLNLTPQLRQALHLLQCSSHELVVEIDRALADNPLLERTDEAEGAGGLDTIEEAGPDPRQPLRWMQATRGIVSDHIPELAAEPSLADHLLQQLHTTRVGALDTMLVSLLIGELDERGFLDVEPAELAPQLPAGVRVRDAEWRIALRLLQSFDPAGVGARDVPECLRLQLQARAGEWPAAACRDAATLTAHLEALAAGRWQALCTRLGWDRPRLEAARTILQQLDPRPARRWQPGNETGLIPDVLLEPVAGRWQLRLNPVLERPLRLDPELARQLTASRMALDGSDDLRRQLQQAHSLLQGLEQRGQTILRVARCIVRRQPGFLVTGLRGLRPLTLRDVAQDLALHESTVSRATRGKYLQAPWGVIELKRLFSGAVRTAAGEGTSARAVQARLQALLQAEPPEHPWSDAELAQQLAQTGIVIARRTVAKYREALGVLPAPLRRRR